MVISECDVLIAVARWLRLRNVAAVRISVAGRRSDRQRVRETLAVDQITAADCHYVSNGPDIVGQSATEYWQVECKGSGTGVVQTQRNNFDRALASVVSYYVDQPPSNSGSVIPYLGLALPATADYMRELRRRVRSPLRVRLNLWVLLFNMSDSSIRAVDPVADYP